uniref:DUF4283 domain-containing protein n=1 Tax=Quercus lobata TaxID=97700 RepID=A0A7N2N957_QUELO
MRRALNVEAIGKTFKPLRRSWNEFKVREASDHILLFVSGLETNAKRVLATKSWSFDKHVVLFRRYDTSVPARYLRFTKVKFWVQIHGLPMRMLDPEIVIKLGETLGTVSPIEHSKEIVGGDFLRVRVEVDVSKPLCRGRGECDIWLGSKGSLSLEDQGYCAWLRALPYNPGKIPYTIVSGFGDGFGGPTIQKPISKHRVVRDAPPVQLPLDETHYPSHYGPMSVDSTQASNMEITNSGEDF